MRKLQISLLVAISLFFFIKPCLLLSQKDKIVVIEGSSQIPFPDYKSRVEVEKQAEQMAIIDALENTFGRAIFSGNHTYIYNLTTHDSVETRDAFSMIGDSFVKGEWLQTLNKECQEIPGTTRMENGKEEKIKDLRCTVKIKARELNEPPVEFKTEVLSLPDKYYVSTDFKNNDQFWLYFTSPISGYVTVYQTDEGFAYRLLPFTGMEKFESGIPVQADSAYIFFSAQPKYVLYLYGQAFKQKEYIFKTNQEYEQNRLFVIMTQNPLNKPYLKPNVNPDILTPNEINKGYDIPNGLTISEFMRWLSKNRFTRNDMQVKMIDVSIRKY